MWAERQWKGGISTLRGGESEGLELQDETGDERLEEGGVVRTGWIKERMDMFRCENDGGVCLMSGRSNTERKLWFTRYG